ncbi:LAME_0F15368g1_1 [Lachancea meyersii CBS 8951]|uniref:LAME_0F15368g1_1 n=1 Tax=Lachancea meyersii CBS 8951 TaxID=1266667 RepID=A0A1G4JYH4_9SACH|nr:LAME_0F15368g1_1 [Lachancea meyersii CBS 8951]
MEPGQLSPQKEQEIALKILERAELAQMTRQLKMGLGKVATPKKSSRVSLDGARVSPLKRARTRENSGSSDLGEVGELRELGERRERKKSPAKRVATPPGSPLRGGREGTELPVPRTPRPRTFGSATSAGATHENHELGADLLMYLATSPYTSSAKPGAGLQGPQTPSAATSNGVGRIPITPSVPHTQLKSQGTAASPHSTFKVPALAVAHHTPLHSASTSQCSDIMDSPHISFYMPSSSPRKRSESTTTTKLGTATAAAASQNLAVPRTPNFNMGDYVHNLFSPSPRVTSGSVRDAKKE